MNVRGSFSRGMFLLVLPAVLHAQQSMEWPRPIPARVHGGTNKDVFVLMLGDVETSLADGTYDPSADELRLKAGTTMKRYYRDSLGVRFFSPIDKTRFPLPPSGWCSWYYYYQEVDENEVKKNAAWIAENLKDFGATYVQIDDGWQGTGHGLGENRDWTTVDRRFPGGMKNLASFIASLGLRPGIWLAPHGQSNRDVVAAHPRAFLAKQDGTSASDTWEGKFLVDPSTPDAHKYMGELFARLTDWGYEYFKIDGQPIVINEYNRKRAFMRDTSRESVVLYRNTLNTIRESIGKNRYLLGCWGTPLEGIGIMNGSRTGGDVVLGWDGFQVAFAATMRNYFLHNIVWYCDPDVMLVRSPITLDQARAWATLQGLTGQALMASDRLTDLPPERVDLMRRVLPAADIRPLDLFPAPRNKRIWDLKIRHLNRSYDVVGAFNLHPDQKSQLLLAWEDLGLPGDRLVHVYDFWSKEYLGCWGKGILVEVPPSACRVLTLLPADGDIQLISTNRHITQGWVDLREFRFDKKTLSFSGKSNVVKGDPYEISFVFARGKNFRIKSAEAGGLPVSVSNYQGWASCQFLPSTSGQILWHVDFEPAEYYSYPVQPPGGLSVGFNGLRSVALQWEAQYNLNVGYQVFVDNELVGYTPVNSFVVNDLDPHKKHIARVHTVWQDGGMSDGNAEAEFLPEAMMPNEIPLSGLEPERATIGWGNVRVNRSVSGGSLSIGGKRFSTGIGTHANSDIEFSLDGLFAELVGAVGLDDGNQSELGSVDFIVLGDGRELWRSGIMKKGDGIREFEVPIRGVTMLTLRVLDAGDSIDYDHADWVGVHVVR